jgi:folate-binding protein YgfZ
MSQAKIAILQDRGVVSVTGPDAAKFLQGLVTNDLGAFETGTPAIFSGLLSPQGKILFDFFIVKITDGYLLDVARDRAADLCKRLTMYRLRAAATITDSSSEHGVSAFWGEPRPSSAEMQNTMIFPDPRSKRLGHRSLIKGAVVKPASTVRASAYHAHRIAIGVPEGGKDYDFGDAYPHEADFDLFSGVSFTKGCYVGQEVVSRMQNKAVVRKRVVKVTGANPLTSGADILLGEVHIGRIGSTDGIHALAMLRLDRALDAIEKGETLIACGTRIAPDPEALDRYRTAAEARPLAGGFPS